MHYFTPQLDLAVTHTSNVSALAVVFLPCSLLPGSLLLLLP